MACIIIYLTISLMMGISVVLKILLQRGSIVHPWIYLSFVRVHVQNRARRGITEPNDVQTLIDAL